MFLSPSSLKGLNTTEVSYPGAPSVEEQMMLFHSGPMDIVPEDVESTKEKGHKQQAITGSWDGLTGVNGPGEAPARTEGNGGSGVVVKNLLSFGAGFAVGVGLCYLVSKR